MTIKVVTVGQAADCGIRIVDEYASAHHAQLIQHGDGPVWVEDLGSTNGTRILRAGVLEERVTRPTRIYPGDVLVVGRTRIPWTPERTT